MAIEEGGSFGPIKTPVVTTYQEKLTHLRDWRDITTPVTSVRSVLASNMGRDLNVLPTSHIEITPRRFPFNSPRPDTQQGTADCSCPCPRLLQGFHFMSLVSVFVVRG
ncbi:hypothetical protein J6590_042859 [Homalodisca vitripennis]|nr:hypothetical protein J6590_042859 [Homalodisca vitripennis]